MTGRLAGYREDGARFMSFRRVARRVGQQAPPSPTFVQHGSAMGR